MIENDGVIAHDVGLQICRCGSLKLAMAPVGGKHDGEQIEAHIPDPEVTGLLKALAAYALSKNLVPMVTIAMPPESDP